MVRVPTSKARKDLAELLNLAAYRGQRIVLNRNGKDVAAIVSLDDLDRLEAFEDRLDYEAGERALTRMKSRRQKPVPWDRVKQPPGSSRQPKRKRTK